ncbi:hypothetical protein LBMAG56_43280 [Verrucomicrobiota bacterium]|nr:hypothetical protein LBMAG56_43280 [Verrucomicrobiota bacterium]
MISTATPSVTPTTEINEITDTNVRFGRKYRRDKESSKGNRDIAADASWHAPNEKGKRPPREGV